MPAPIQMVSHPSSSLFKFIAMAGVFIVALNLAIIREVIWDGNEELFAEGQFIENLTAFALLCGATILFGGAFFRQGLSRFLLVSLATINLIGFLREVDVADYNVPSPFLEIASNDVKDGLFTVVMVGLILVGLKNYRQKLGVVWRGFWNPTGWLLMSGGGLFFVACVAEMFESKFIEELLEANAAMLFLCGSFLCGRHDFDFGSNSLFESSDDSGP